MKAEILNVIPRQRFGGLVCGGDWKEFSSDLRSVVIRLALCLVRS